MEKISVIVPCFNEEKALPLFYEELVKNIKVWVDAEYAAGRVTVLTDEELVKVIDEVCVKLGISLK